MSLEIKSGLKITHGLNRQVGTSTGRHKDIQPEGSNPAVIPARRWHEFEFNEDVLDKITKKKTGEAKVKRLVAEDHLDPGFLEQAAETAKESSKETREVAKA